MADFYGIDNKIELHEVRNPHAHQEDELKKEENLDHEQHGLASINEGMA